MNSYIPLSQPDISDLERDYVRDVLLTPNLCFGPWLVQFEEIFADYVNAKYAIAVNSGTSALHCCVKSFGIGPGDEVITTPFSFIATSNCILFENATPVFIDIDLRTYNIDVEKIEEKITRKTKAIIPVHVFGLPANMTRIREIASKYNLKIIEDSAEAIGSEIEGSRVGIFGDCGIFAFYPNKQITTGEGGMIVTNDEMLNYLCRSFRNQGRGNSNGWLQHERIGYNYRLSDINCALGIAQMKRIDSILKRREQVADLYMQELANVDEVEFQYTPPKYKKSWFVFVVLLNSKFTSLERNEILLKLNKAGIGCNNYFSPIHLQPFMMKQFGFKKGDFPNTEFISERTIALPFFTKLSMKEIEFIINTFKKILLEYQ